MTPKLFEFGSSKDHSDIDRKYQYQDDRKLCIETIVIEMIGQEENFF